MKTTEPIDVEAIRARHWHVEAEGGAMEEEIQADREALLAEVDRLRAAEQRHALANGGCVPKPAYDELAEECRRQAWDVLTRIATSHRHCDCTGSFPCGVRQVVDRFGVEFAARDGQG